MNTPTKEELAPQWVVFLLGMGCGVGLFIAFVGAWVGQVKLDREEKRLDNIEKRMDEMVKQINGHR